MNESLVAVAVAVAAAATLGAPAVAVAQNADLAQIRQQIQDLRNDYESRIKALEDQLKVAETAAKRAEQSAAQAKEVALKAESTAGRAEQVAGQVESSAVQATQRSDSQNVFNPAISLILNGTYGRYGNDPTTQITGFAPSGGEVMPSRGLSLGESELFLSASVDPYFRGALLVALTPENSVEVEEAYFETLALGKGFTIKGGRFFSGIGYLNSVHPHAWDFVDASLVQTSFLGRNYGDDGLQMRWVAPLPVFLQLGAEIGRGREFAGAGEVERNSNGADSYALFAKLGGDIGVSHSYQLGASYLKQKSVPEGVAFLDYDDLTGVTNSYVGNQTISGVDFVYKWAPDGHPTERNFKFVTEWFQRKYDGDFTFDTAGIASTDLLKANQSGWYAQAIYQFVPYWRVGVRYDRLSHGNVDLYANAANLAPPDFDPKRYSVMLDWSPSEYSRIRLQYNRDLSRQDTATGSTITDNQVFLQYIFSLGAHGAHKF